MGLIVKMVTHSSELIDGFERIGEPGQAAHYDARPLQHFDGELMAGCRVELFRRYDLEFPGEALKLAGELARGHRVRVLVSNVSPNLRKHAIEMDVFVPH